MKTALAVIFALALATTSCGESTSTTGAAPTDDTETTQVAPTPDGDESTDAIPPDEVVFIWAESGGCAMAGPNCARYEVTAGGDVATYRDGDDEASATGSIDPARVAEWIELVGGLDLDGVVARLGPGETKAAFDGVDHSLSAPQAQFDISSTEAEFDESEPLFVNAFDLAALAAEAAPLEIQFR